MLSGVYRARYHAIGIAFINHHGAEVRNISHHIPGHFEVYIFGLAQFVQRINIIIILLRMDRVVDF
ncbi:hypothetical protein D3C85_1354930 [compost metagenome]